MVGADDCAGVAAAFQQRRHPPGSLVVQTLTGSWANIAHLEPTGQLPGAASGLPTPWTAIFKWDAVKATLGNNGAYRRFFRGLPSYTSDYPVITQYDAYWVDAPAPNVASPNPYPPAGRAVSLQAGVRPGLELRPHIVATIKFEGVTKDAATKRLSLRDPKIATLRPDKSASEASTVEDIEAMYRRERLV